MMMMMMMMKLVYEYLLWIKANVDVRLSIMRVALRRRYFVYGKRKPGHVIKCESAKVHMYKMRKLNAKDFAFYTSTDGVDLSHFRIIGKCASYPILLHKYQ